MPTSTTAKRPLLTKPLTMLIDYDNLSALTRKRGLRHTIDYVLSNLPAALLPDGVPVSVRPLWRLVRQTPFVSRRYALSPPTSPKTSPQS